MHASTLSRTLRTLTTGAVLFIAACTSVWTGPAPSGDVYRSAIDSPIRTDQDRRMDEARHPVEFLQFAQVRPGMRALDVSAGAGYTSQLIALVVGPSGRLWAQAPNPGATLQKRLADHPQPNLMIVARPFDDPVPPEAMELDLVTLVLNYHDISYLPVDRAKMNARIFAALRPGGHLVVIDHSAKAGTGISAGRTLHRIDEEVVRREVTQAGFALEAEGAFLRNPADTRDESSNQPTVPTDKFALRFVKPA
jgi:predicted methyltransferase